MSSLRARSKAKAKAPSLRSWGATLIRKRGQFLGWVEAPDPDAPEAAAVKRFELSDEQRRRLLAGAHLGFCERPGVR